MKPPIGERFTLTVFNGETEEEILVEVGDDPSFLREVPTGERVVASPQALKDSYLRAEATHGRPPEGTYRFRIVEASVGDDRSADVATEESFLPPEPPRVAVWMLHFFSRSDDREAMIGDLIETYHRRKVPTLGVSGARAWFAKEVFWSLIPVFHAWLIRSLFAALAIKTLWSWLRR